MTLRGFATDLELGVLSRVEAVHAGEALARGTTTEQLHVSLEGQALTQVILRLTLVIAKCGVEHQ
jgi:hypothetical protein